MRRAQERIPKDSSAPPAGERGWTTGRHVLIYGFIGGILITVLKWTEYRFLVIEHSIEIYGGLIAATFAALGIWLGLKLTGRQQKIVVREVPVPAVEPFIPDEKKREDLNITRRDRKSVV